MKYLKEKSILFASACVMLAFFAFVQTASAQISQAFSFQGKITETDGSELADGAYDFRFRLYDVPSGGAALWSEDILASTSFAAELSNGVTLGNITTYDYTVDSNESSLRVGQYLSDAVGNAYLIADFDTGANTISVTAGSLWADGTAVNNRPYVEGGIIDIALGSVSSLAGIDADQPLYLEVIFEGETMSPRKPIIPVLQAVNSDTLDGFHASDFANLTADATVSGQWSFNNIVSIATSSAQTALSISQNGTGDLVDFRVGGTSAFAILNDGRVQIGDYRFPTTYGAPGYVLKTDLNGDLYWAVDWAGVGGGIGLWATSTDSLLIVQSDVGQKIVFGNTGTTSPITAQLEVQGLSWFDTVAVSNAQSLRFYDTDSSNYISLRATGTLASNYVLTLPPDYGVAGLALLTDGLGNLSWGTSSGAIYANVGTQGQLAFYQSNGSTVSGTSSLFVADNGFIGVGTSSPLYRMDVNGDVRISGNIYADNINTATTTTNYANVKTVAKAGADYVTIQEAVNALSCSAVAPCLVRVMPGVYDEQVVINNKSYISVVSAGGPEATIIAPSTADEAIVVSGSSGHVRVEGFGVEIGN